MEISIDQLHPLILNVGFARHDADWNFRNVRSPFSRIYYVTEGTAKVEMEGKTYTLRPDHLYMIPAYIAHTNFCTGLFCHYYVHIYEDQHNTSAILENFQYPVELDASSLDLDLFKKLVEINPQMKLPDPDPHSYDNDVMLKHNLYVNRGRTFSARAASRGILFILMSRFLGNAKARVQIYDNKIGEALAFIRSHISGDLDIGTIADETGFSKDHFIRLFKKEIGQTPMHYINQKKIERAELMLLAQDTPVKNIAYSLSFSDCGYFNRVFKRYTGKTPMEYRMAYRNK